MASTTSVLNVQVVPNVPMYGTVKQTMNPAWIQYFRTLNQRVGGPTGGVVNSIIIADTSATPIYAITNTETSGAVTIDFTLDTQAPALAFLGPISGANAQPTFRALATTDLPIVDYLHGGTGLNAVPGEGQLIIGNGSSYTLSTLTGTANEIHIANGAGDITLSFPTDVTINTLTVSNTLTVDSTGSFVGAIGVNNLSPPAQSTGWGTPTAGGIIGNFPDSGATTAQCGEVISELIAILKGIGFLGA